MAFRITHSVSGSIIRVRIEGWLEAIGITELRGTCFPTPDACCVLDLSGLASADAAGIEVLRSLIADGAKAHGANPYVRDLLAESGS